MATPNQSSTEWRLSPECGEVRLGLVVYGGVSLAIYINGVAHELFRAVRGRGIYKLLKRLLDADIVVDIISGTSAGGINGLLLAYALTNEREFGECGALWRDHGSLAKLLRRVEDEAAATSLMDSRGYYLPQLENALRSMAPIGADARQREAPSRFDELDLFVTGTDFDGRITTAVDATGRQIDIKSHRTVFELKHRARRKTPFHVSPSAASARDAVTISALAKLAAITSCFPAAFEPIHVAPAKDDPHEQAVYELLKEWGDLSGETWFVDGGVLDNKPFSHTIQGIFSRTASRPVNRMLFYVEPDPERFDPSQRIARAAPPSAVEAAMEALLGIPGYESIAEDLAYITRRNDRLHRQARVRQAAEKAFEHLRDTAPAVPAIHSIPPSVRGVYQHVRLAQLSERAVRGLMEGEGFKRRVHRRSNAEPSSARGDRAREERDRRRVAKMLAQAFDVWSGDGARTLDRYDPYFRLRRAFHMTYEIARVVNSLSGTTVDEANQAGRLTLLARLKTAWETVNQQVATYEIVQWAIERALDRHPLPRKLDGVENASQVWRSLAARLDHLLDVDGDVDALFTTAAPAEGEPAGFSEAARGALHKILSRRVHGGPPPGYRPHAGPNLLMRLDQHTAALLQTQLSGLPGLFRKWDDFLLYDAHFFPIDYFAGLGEKDPIDVVRISPLDAERAFCSRRFEDKITGETVMHFGAFLKRSWRSNDIMWGRLDGVCRVLDALLTPDALKKAMQRPAVRALLRDDVASGALEPAALFPSAGARLQGRVRAWLERLASDDEGVRNAAAADEEMQTILLWCEQLEILGTDLPIVLEDAAIEQIEWNSRIVRSGTAVAAFEPLATHVDLSPAIIAGRELTRQFIDRLKNEAGEFSEPKDVPLAKHFLTQYMVGAENVREHIPPAVLLETLTTGLLVARNCLVNAFPAYARRVTSSLAYRALVDWPLTTAHTLAVFARRERPLYLGGLSVLITYAALALAAAVLWPESALVGDDGEISQASVVVLVLVPLLILGPVAHAAWVRATMHRRSLWGGLATAALAFVGFTVAVVVGAAFAASWRAAAATLGDWMVAAIGPLDTPAKAWLPTFALGGMVLVLLVIAPALRGLVYRWAITAQPWRDWRRRLPYWLPRRKSSTSVAVVEPSPGRGQGQGPAHAAS